MMWRSALSEEDRVAILARLPPARLPAILKNSLTPGLLLDVMECGAGALRRARGEVVAAALLEGLSKVRAPQRGGDLRGTRGVPLFSV